KCDVDASRAVVGRTRRRSSHDSGATRHHTISALELSRPARIEERGVAMRMTIRIDGEDARDATIHGGAVWLRKWRQG
ncbi:hypothetical protein VIGAN_09155900, partial [Vigna angularis var. angularis]